MLDLPPAAVVPLVVSGAHLLHSTPQSTDWAVQFFVLGAVFMLLEGTAGHEFSWFLVTPLVTAGILGPLLHTFGDTFLRKKKLY
jgi:hypothetical protein